MHTPTHAHTNTPVPNTHVPDDQNTDLCFKIKTWHDLMLEERISQSELAKRVGRDRTKVCKLLKVLDLPEEVRTYISQKSPSENAVLQITQGGYADSESMIAALKRSGRSATRKQNPNPKREKTMNPETPLPPNKTPLLNAATKQHLDNTLDELKDELIEHINTLEQPDPDLSSLSNKLESLENVHRETLKQIAQLKQKADDHQASTSLRTNQLKDNFKTALENQQVSFQKMIDKTSKQHQTSLAETHSGLNKVFVELTEMREGLKKSKQPTTWQEFGQKCSSVAGFAYLTAIAFLYALLVVFGSKALLYAGFSEVMAITGSNVCELLAVITGVMFANAKSKRGLALSGTLLIALTATLCYFSFQTAIDQGKARVGADTAVAFAEQEYKSAAKAYQDELKSVQSLPADHISSREKRQPFLTELKKEKIQTMSMLKAAQAEVDTTETSAVQVLEIALRIIGTLALTMLTHAFVHHVLKKDN